MSLSAEDLETSLLAKKVNCILDRLKLNPGSRDLMIARILCRNPELDPTIIIDAIAAVAGPGKPAPQHRLLVETLRKLDDRWEIHNSVMTEARRNFIQTLVYEIKDCREHQMDGDLIDQAERKIDEAISEMHGRMFRPKAKVDHARYVGIALKTIKAIQEKEILPPAGPAIIAAAGSASSMTPEALMAELGERKTQELQNALQCIEGAIQMPAVFREEIIEHGLEGARNVSELYVRLQEED